MDYVIVAVVSAGIGCLGGGYLGYRWGREAERRANALIGAVTGAAKTLGGAGQSAVQAVKDSQK